MHREDMKLIAKVGFDHYRVDVELFRDGWKEILGRGLEEAGIMGLRLELGLIFSVDHARELDDFMSETIPGYDRVTRILVFARNHLSDDRLFCRIEPEPAGPGQSGFYHLVHQSTGPCF